MSAQITPLADGPLKVDGSFKIVKADGGENEHQGSAYLCRCGHSANKPFCDGAHTKQAFKAA